VRCVAPVADPVDGVRFVRGSKADTWLWPETEFATGHHQRGQSTAGRRTTQAACRLEHHADVRAMTTPTSPLSRVALPIFLALIVGGYATILMLGIYQSEGIIHKTTLALVLVAIAVVPISLETIARLRGAGITVLPDGFTLRSAWAALTGRAVRYFPYDGFTGVTLTIHSLFTSNPYQTMRLTTPDSAVRIDPRYDRLPALVPMLFQPIERALLAHSLAAFNESGRVEIGNVVITREGISHDGNALDWQSLTSVAAAGDDLLLYRSENALAMIIPVKNIPNAPILPALIDALRLTLT
jgi:hypothetical protein